MKSFGFFPDMNNLLEVAAFLRRLEEAEQRDREQEDPDWDLWVETDSGRPATVLENMGLVSGCIHAVSEL